jgi:hypothetical protein
LDTHPYNAHTTAADALMSGLPVVTFMGGAFPARVAASLLHAIGLPELVADSFDGYEKLALHLAQSPQELAALKIKLACNRESTALFNTREFCRNLENIYESMWYNSQVNEVPALPIVESAAVVELEPPLHEDFSVGSSEADILRGNLQKAEMQCR